MPGYRAVTTSPVSTALGVQSLYTQSALSYISGDTVSITNEQTPSIVLIGSVLAYNGITGVITVNVTYVSNTPSVTPLQPPSPLPPLQPVWNTQPWGYRPTGTTASISLQPVWNTQVWGAVPEGTIGSIWILDLVAGISPTLPTLPTIWVRSLDARGDPQRGGGLSNFVTDIRAVAQIISQKIKLLQGEWYENLNSGTPMFQNLLGVPQTVDGVALILRKRILGCPYVTGINSFTAAYYTGRIFTFTASVQTVFGEITVTNAAAQGT